MKKLITHFYSINPEHCLQMQAVAQQFDEIDLRILTSEKELVQAISSKAFDLLLIDKSINEDEIKRTYMLVEILHPDAAYTAVEMGIESYVPLKLNQLIKNWKKAQENYRFFPLY